MAMTKIIYRMKYFLILLFALLSSSCITNISVLSPVPHELCIFYARIPRHPVHEATHWLCRSVGARGAAFVFEKGGTRVIFPKTDNFKSASSVVTEEFAVNLDSVAVVMERFRDTHALIIGYTDESDGKDDNKKLAFRRAEAVAAYLITQGVSPEKLVIEASQELVGTGLAGRRVEMVIFKGEYVRSMYTI